MYYTVLSIIFYLFHQLSSKRLIKIGKAVSETARNKQTDKSYFDQRLIGCLMVPTYWVMYLHVATEFLMVLIGFN